MQNTSRDEELPSKRAERLVSALIAVLGCRGASAQASSTQAQMHAKVVALYSFSPHSVTDQVRTAKSAEMDAFWAEVKASPAALLPQLRVELQDSSDPPFFMADGAELLSSLSKETADQQLAADAFARCDLADIQSRAYFYSVHSESMQGIDTTRAGLHVLDDPTFAVVVPQHAMTLDQTMSAVYLLLPLPADLWFGAMEKRFAAERDLEARKTMLWLAFYAQTGAADAFLKRVANDPAQAEAIRAEAHRHLQDEQDVLRSKLKVSGTESSIREKRRQRLGQVSDEAIDDIQKMTAELISLRNPR